jgi:hypothetical protein
VHPSKQALAQMLPASADRETAKADEQDADDERDGSRASSTNGDFISQASNMCPHGGSGPAKKERYAAV